MARDAIGARAGSTVGPWRARTAPQQVARPPAAAVRAEALDGPVRAGAGLMPTGREAGGRAGKRPQRAQHQRAFRWTGNWMRGIGRIVAAGRRLICVYEDYPWRACQANSCTAWAGDGNPGASSMPARAGDPEWHFRSPPSYHGQARLCARSMVERTIIASSSRLHAHPQTTCRSPRLVDRQPLEVRQRRIARAKSSMDGLKPLLRTTG